MVEIGRLCVKTAGRDNGNFALVIDIMDDTYVLIDGNVRRKKCNLKHLEFLDKIIKIKKNASTEEVKGALEREGIKILKRGEKRESKEKPRGKRKGSKKEEKKEENK